MKSHPHYARVADDVENPLLKSMPTDGTYKGLLMICKIPLKKKYAACYSMSLSLTIMAHVIKCFGKVIEYTLCSMRDSHVFVHF